MYIWTFTLLFVACYTIYRYFKNSLSYFKDNEIPHIPGWPIFGNMGSFMLRKKHLSDIVRDIYNVNLEAKYVGAFDFMRPVIVIRDPELIKTVAIKSFDHFTDHNVYIDDSLDPLLGGNLPNMRGDRWKEARALLSPAFTGSKMKAMHELIVECVKNLVNHISELSEDERQNVATKDLFTKVTNDAIATSAFGIKIDSLKNPDNDFYILGKEATGFSAMKILKFTIARASPWIYKFFKLKFISDKASSFFTGVIQRTVDMRDKENISRPDMIQLMMNARDKKSEHLKLDITEMTAQAFVFFFGGFDTTSTQMCIIAHELAINPDIQMKLQNEIDDVTEKCGGDPTYEDIQNMLYLDAVFNESMRRHNQIGYIDRVCAENFELPPALPGGKPFTLETGMSIWFPATGIHRDPKYYENPDKFDPDRYYEKKVTINDVMNLGFGIGPRGCIGNRFAILETKIVFFYLLQKFNLKPNEKTCSPFDYNKASFPIEPVGGFSLIMEPRR